MKDNKQDWEKEFDVKFGMKEFLDDTFVKHGTYTNEIKSFISQKLKEQKEQITHDHEILVNTILEDKERKLKEQRERIIDSLNQEFEWDVEEYNKVINKLKQ